MGKMGKNIGKNFLKFNNGQILLSILKSGHTLLHYFNVRKTLFYVTLEVWTMS